MDIECWGTQGSNVAFSLHRNYRAIVAGQIKYDQWEQNGQTLSRIMVKATAVDLSLEFQSYL